MTLAPDAEMDALDRENARRNRLESVPPVAPNLVMLPTPRPAFYLYGESGREDFLVIGVATTTPERPTAFDMHSATWLLCLRPDGRGCWMRLSSLTFEMGDQ